jgi:hypothetical protein
VIPPPPPPLPVVDVSVGVGVVDPPSVGVGWVGLVESEGVAVGDEVTFCGCTKIVIEVPLGSIWP